MGRVIWNLILLVVSWVACFMLIGRMELDGDHFAGTIILVLISFMVQVGTTICIGNKNNNLTQIKLINSAIPGYLIYLIVKWFRGLPNA